MNANAINDRIVVTSLHKIEGTMILETPCSDYDFYTSLPQCVMFDGKYFGKTGWSSDTGYACYKDNQHFAKIL